MMRLDELPRRHFLDGRVALYAGDCLDVLRSLPDDSVDSGVTDPPYHLTSIVKRFGAENAAPAKAGKTGAYARASRGFMGQQWDGGDIAFRVELWAEVFRVLKPGAHLVAFSGTRTYHRMACAIEDAGFEVRDQLAWCFGSGFPKSHDAGGGWGTALKPAWEPIGLARKPLVERTVVANVLRHGTGALNVGACRIEGAGAEAGRKRHGGGVVGNGMSYELPDSHGEMPAGRWPANLVHDGSDEVVAAFPDAPGQQRASRDDQRTQGNVYGAVSSNSTKEHKPRGDAGSAARFFYSAKADADDRVGSGHPTVKPVDLMQWLVRLVTPKGGLVLDPFAGTGTTGEAAWREGMRAVLIEREPVYCDDIARRMSLCLAGPEERARASLKAANARKGVLDDHGPLFAPAAE